MGGGWSSSVQQKAGNKHANFSTTDKEIYSKKENNLNKYTKSLGVNVHTALRNNLFDTLIVFMN